MFHEFCKNPPSSFCQQNNFPAEFSSKNNNRQKFCIQIFFVNPPSSFCQQNNFPAEFSAKNNNRQKFCIQIFFVGQLLTDKKIDRQKNWQNSVGSIAARSSSLFLDAIIYSLKDRYKHDIKIIKLLKNIVHIWN